MELVDKIDKNATARRVRRFFQDDDQLPRLKRLSGAWGELKSPTIDPTGVHGGGQNATEDRFITHADYYRAYSVAIEAIDGCDYDSRVILRQKYLKGLEGWKVASKLGVGETQFKWRDRRACWQYADCLEGLVKRYGIDQEMLPDLHVVA